MIHPLIKLAQERRRSNGTWFVTMVVEGYDDEFTYHVGGSLSKEVAGEYARYYLYRDARKKDHTLKLDHIHLKSIERQ